eukprot:CAMPEP_0172483906 /NCGR_PEP_ID=MMETSP1066-20121228/11122_1 /TAXON_ID=671091 /ORGANISM="Coscinodiscus wailesii, Strain CCMP2513" /LENGTH=753 /DNA_ID=CAMNT_0013248087 /DNA_START=110 /DNA_END=2371 /DNA_ORIENTATION=-
MRHPPPSSFLLTALLPITTIHSFVPSSLNNKPTFHRPQQQQEQQQRHHRLPRPLSVSIGTGPKDGASKYDNYTRFRDGEEYEFSWACEYRPKDTSIVEPDHELHRKDRLSDIDRTCDEWFEDLLGGSGDDEEEKGFLGGVSATMRERLLTPVKLEHDPPRQWFVGFQDDEDWSPYGHFRLPGEIIYPAFGLETFGLPVIRQFAECWRHFDVPGLVNQDYSLTPEGTGTVLDLDDTETAAYQTKLTSAGAWIPDSDCAARLVYINGRFAPSLSKTTSAARHLSSSDFATPGAVRDEIVECLSRLPEGHTDELATEEGQDDLKDISGSYLFSGLSGPDHNFRRATAQNSINNQQGMAAFCALNAVRAGGVALVDVPGDESVLQPLKEFEEKEIVIIGKPVEVQRETIVDEVTAFHEEREGVKPVLIVNAIDKDLGFVGVEDEERGVAVHPRTLIIANKGSKSEVVQQCVDLSADEAAEGGRARFYNGVTQAFVRSGASLKHTYVDETGGQVTPDVEGEHQGPDSPASIEANRPSLRDTHFELLDIQLTGRYGQYTGTHVAVGGSGKVKVAVSTTLNQKYTKAHINGMLVTGGAQNTDMRGFVHHVSPLGTCDHQQRNVIGGCGDATWKGRIRMDAECHNSVGNQLCKSLLLSDAAHILSMPTLDIICNTVQCAHGATVADLNDDELLYLQSRGLDRNNARNLLMYGFVDEIGKTINRSIFGRREDGKLRIRILKQLANLVPKGEKSESSKEYTSI